MPTYDYYCGCGVVTEARQGISVEAIPCPACGQSAERVPFYTNQYINGETVAKGITKATRAGNVKDKHGRYRLSIFEEASAEVNHDYEKAENEVGHELPRPPLWEEGLNRARKIREAIP